MPEEITGIPDDLNECRKCGATREGHSYMLLYGDWGPDREGWSRRPCIRPLCRSCYSEHYDRTVGAHWRVEDAEKLWDVLEASQGELVADLKPCFVGGRPFIRVVDDELRGISMRPYTPDNEHDVAFKPERMDDLDRDWLSSIIDQTAALPDDSVPTIAIIRPVEETPFGDVRDRGEHSRKLGEYTDA